MNHVVYLNHKAKELENLLNGTKTVILWHANEQKLPNGNVEKAMISISSKNVVVSLIK